MKKVLLTSLAATTVLLGSTAYAAKAPAANATSASTATAAMAAPVNINTADVTVLENVKGLGPTKAQAIVDYRTKNGNFKSVQDLQNVAGIGPKLIDKLQGSLTVN